MQEYCDRPDLVRRLEIVPGQNSFWPFFIVVLLDKTMTLSHSYKSTPSWCSVCSLIMTAKARHNKEKSPLTLIPESVNRRKGGGVASLPPPKWRSEIKIFFPSSAWKKRALDVHFVPMGYMLRELCPRRVRWTLIPECTLPNRLREYLSNSAFFFNFR